MLCKATEADLEQMVAFRRKTYGGTRQDALDWLCGIVRLDNILILARDPAPGAKSIPAAMIGAVPVECGHHHGVWLCCMATDPSLQGRGLMPKLLATCLRAFSAKGCDFAVAAPQSTRAAKAFSQLNFQGRFPLRYQPACIALPESSMNTMITRLYRRGMTIVSNQRGYGLYCQEKDELLFMELQADNDHSADILLQAAREHTGLTKARLLLAENQFLYLGEGKRCGYGMICYLGQPFPVTDVYFRLLL